MSPIKSRLTLVVLIVGCVAIASTQDLKKGPDSKKRRGDDGIYYFEDCAMLYPTNPWACTDGSGHCMFDYEKCDGFTICDDKGDEDRSDCGWGETDANGCTKPKQIGNTGTKDLEDQILEAQNYFRCLHGVPALTWDSKLAAAARPVAAANAAGGLAHSDLPHGENIDMLQLVSEDRQTGYGFSNRWYKEIADYNFYNPDIYGYSGVTGHFTQVVWKETTKVGCAFANKKGSPYTMYVVVCEYDPPGNKFKVESFKENVPLLKVVE